ncbi:VanZ family protein [Rummeliibacillus stabekisii]|uniref:VanZ family protein n=1 Tax=Rummeliibacillus stabekisii TaxID=241244 RepID=UPI00203D96D0|nr:VanZ family protein [Rummeliibacillus stabekisii]MCM3315946.1 VanZ family protein [Rummeliibacillus stabekisii]
MLIDFDESIMLIAAFFWIIIILFLKIKYKKSYVYLFFFTIFFIYLCNVLKYTQFPIILDGEMKKEIGQNVWKDANFLPFNPDHFEMQTSLLNILLTFPFGFGLPFISKVSFKKIVVLGFLLGVFIEISQLIIALMVGFTTRYVDVNDIIFNFSGVLLGYGVFKLFLKSFKFLIKKNNIELNSFLKFILNSHS